MEHSIVHTIFRGLEFSPDELPEVERALEKLVVKKGDILLTAGQFVPYQYYVHEGCLRTYYHTDNGKEHTLQFAISDWWISDYTAFFTAGRSIFYMDCIQDAIIYKLSKESMDELYKKFPEIEVFFRIKMERFFGSFQRRILSDLAMTAKEKYQRFLDTYPSIEQHIKNYHLASYLGITTESLSRVRKEMARR